MPHPEKTANENRPPRPFWAHSPNAKELPGKLRAHLEEVGATAGKFADVFNADDLAQAAGMLHDLGKYSPEFQRRVRGETSENAPHSAFGASEARKLWPGGIGEIIAWCVAGHHTGLADHADLLARLEGEFPDLSKSWQADGFRAPPKPALPEFCRDPFSVHFLVRMVFSRLVDADRLAAQKHFNPDFADTRRARPAIDGLREKLNRHLAKQFSNAKQTEANTLRDEVLCACREKAKLPPGFFSLSVPTGGGKTLIREADGG